MIVDAKIRPNSIDEYISTFPSDIQERLQKIRETIKQAAPEAVETISYGMPAFRQGGILVYFAAFKDHIGFFPTASGITAFEKELSQYKFSKGTIHFPYSEPIPFDLVDRIVRYRVEDIEGKARAKGGRRAK
jgi:uncharacterized protein YdhG (YjbR/CyaY superfamily)